MAADESSDERVAAKTYVPAYQKEDWKAHAEQLNMTQSEFIRTMVQAGRRGFTLDPEEGQTTDDTPGEGGVKDTVLDVIESEGALDWDELLAALTESVEDELEGALDELQDENEIRYSGRHGGYTLRTRGDE